MVKSGTVWVKGKKEKIIRVIRVFDDEKRHVDIRQLGEIHRDLIPYDEFIREYTPYDEYTEECASSR